MTMKHFAIIGAGMAGISAARTLVQAGHRVSVFEKSRGAGGRMATRETPFGNFDHGAQYFTVRDPRFELALSAVPGTRDVFKAWSANAVRVLDTQGRVVEAALPSREFHHVGTPGMNALVRHWAQPLLDSGSLHLNVQVHRLARDSLNPQRWQVHAEGDSPAVWSGFDAVLLALPHVQAQQLLRQSSAMVVGQSLLDAMDPVRVAPCWTLMLAYPQASQPSLAHLGPQWNAARSTHHRVAWLARESSKPGRLRVERWTVQASAAWSEEHLEDDPLRVQAKLTKAFAELTGIRAEPSHAEVHRWRFAKTTVPLGQAYLWDATHNLGTCGDWHLGHRVEDAFVSGLSLALAVR
jgi:renalase